MRCGTDELPGSSSMSPLPTSFSAPGWSRITRESVRLDDGERDARRDVRLDHAGDDVHARALRGDDQVDADGAGLLGDAGDRVLDVARRHHHQVVELVDDDDDVRQALVRSGRRVIAASSSAASRPGRTPRCSR